MTRKEERCKEAWKYTDEHFSTADNDFQNAMRIAVTKAHFAASEWADRTMIFKACKWLEDNLYDYAGEDDKRNIVPFDKTVFEDFRKAMKGT